MHGISIGMTEPDVNRRQAGKYRESAHADPTGAPARIWQRKESLTLRRPGPLHDARTSEIAFATLTSLQAHHRRLLPIGALLMEVLYTAITSDLTLWETRVALSFRK